MTSISEPQSKSVPDARAGAGAEVLQALFADGERWGWEWRDTEKLRVRFPVPVPAEPVIAPPDEAAAAAAAYSSWRSKLILIVPGAFFGALLVFVPLDLLVGPGTAQGIWNGLAVMAAMGWVIRRTVTLRRRTRELRPGTGPFLARQEALMRQHQQARAAWEAEAGAYAEREDARVKALPVYGAIRPEGKPLRIDIFGGTFEGWQAITTTLGASLLGCGERLAVLDLSETGVASLLFSAAAERGLPTRVSVLPSEVARLDILGGLSPQAVKALLLETFHASAGSDPKDRALDDNILASITEVLAPPDTESAPRLSMQRYYSALRVLLREDEQVAAGASVLSIEEADALQDLFGDEYREVIRRRLVDLASQLRPLRSIGSDPDQRSSGDSQVACEGIAIGEEGDTFLTDLLVNLLVQRMIRQLQVDRQGRPMALFVIGADRLKTEHLDKLSDVSEARGARIVYLYRRLRGEAVEVIGAGGAVVGIMRTGTPAEAEHAANLIGREYRFKLAQETTTIGTNWTRSEGGAETRMGMPSASVNWGEGRGGSDSFAKAKNRVHEYVIEPEVLKSLSPTAFFLLRPARGAAHVPVAGDCDPRIAGLPLTSALPFDAR
jgi:hypothetical protein